MNIKIVPNKELAAIVGEPLIMEMLAKNSDFLLTIPTIKEASLLSAPTTSALMMLALGDAIMVSLHEAKGFSKDDFSS